GSRSDPAADGLRPRNPRGEARARSVRSSMPRWRRGTGTCGPRGGPRGSGRTRAACRSGRGGLIPAGRVGSRSGPMNAWRGATPGQARSRDGRGGTFARRCARSPFHPVDSIFIFNTDHPTSTMAARGHVWSDFSFVVSSGYREKVLSSLAPKPKVPRQLADETDLRVVHVSRALRELSDRGLVECLTPEVKARGRLYGLTPDGAALLGELNGSSRY